jgi:serine/threonine protein kinase
MLAHALKMMHQNRICHRDIKMDNILITDSGKIKLIDFGFSVMCDKDAKLQINCGTPAFMAPEIVKK